MGGEGGVLSIEGGFKLSAHYVNCCKLNITKTTEVISHKTLQKT